MKKILLAVLLLATIAVAEPGFKKVTVTITATPVVLPVGTRNLVLVNDGAETVVFRLFGTCETAVDVELTCDNCVQLLPTEAIVFDWDPDSTERKCEPGGSYKELSVIVSTATSDLRITTK